MPQSLPKFIRSLIVNSCISLGITILILLFTQDILFEFSPLKRIELSLIDMRFQHRGRNFKYGNSSKVVIVEISQESFKSLPERWPWPRTYFAKLIRNLKRAGARAIGIDVIFTSGDSRDSRNDEELFQTLHEAGNVVLAGKLDSERRNYTTLTRENFGNIYIDSSSVVGLVNTRVDADGVLRRYMPFGVNTLQNQRIPTFSFALLNVYFKNTPAYTAEIADNYFQYRDKYIPMYDQTSMLINYYGPSGTFRRMKFEDILDDQDFETVEEKSIGQSINTFDDPDNGYLYDGTFQDKIVLVGSTMPEDKDLFSVPIAEGRQTGDNQMYGVEIHANVIQNILDRNFIRCEPLWITSFVVFLLSMFTFALIAGLKKIKVRFSALIEIFGVIIILAELFIFYWISLKLFTHQNLLVDMSSPFLAIIVSYVGGTVYNYIAERKQKMLIKSMFSHYVNKDVVNELIEHPEKLSLSGERRDMTVMFTDIENFTALAEKTKPEKLVSMLNGYLNEMTKIIFSNSGTVDKYEGDAIMAFWGAPIPQQEHATLACKAAVEMQQTLINIRQQWIAEGLKPINVRVGINTGEMIVGNIGGSGKFEYTVIGDSVNIGSRLESANKLYRTNIMISGETYKKVIGKVIARELDMLVVAGKTEPIHVYELMEMNDGKISSEQKQFVDLFTKGLNCYRKREWKLAIEIFTEVLELVPDDYPSRIYIERSRLYENSSLPDNWDGVFILPTK